ncbi:MAG: hypothetical protein ABIP29_04460 [Candidatus Eisenbacteria bacterium]
MLEPAGRPKSRSRNNASLIDCSPMHWSRDLKSIVKQLALGQVHSTMRALPPGPRLILASMLSAILAIGCEGTTEPSSRWDELVGAWTFSFVASDSTLCDPPVPQGCGGVGLIRFVRSGLEKQGTWTGSGGCQTCGSAADFIGGELQDVQSSPTSIAFRYGEFQFDATLPPGEFDGITGTMSYSPTDGADVHGTWRMDRATRDQPWLSGATRFLAAAR